MKFSARTIHPAKQRHPVLLCLLCAAGVFAAGLALALGLHNNSTYHTGSWDDYSEALVFGRMLQMQQNQSAPGGFMGVYTEDWGGEENRYLYRENTPVAPGQYNSYTHQSGLQGWALGLANKVFSVFEPDGAARESLLYLLNSVLFYAAALAVGLALWRAGGWLCALGWLGGVLCAPWVQTGMKDLYWCLWLWLAPLLAGLTLCAAVRRRGKAPFWAYALVFAACMLRCMCGFEFVSTFLILCEAPLFYCWVAARRDRPAFTAWLLRMVKAGTAALGGVAAALGVWLVQGRLYYGDWAGSLQNIAGAAGSRMSVSDDGVKAGVSVLGVLYKYIVADATVVLRLGGLELTLWQLLAVTLAGAALLAGLLLLCGGRARLAALLPALCAWGLAFLAPVSWLALSKAHADIHTQLIPMLWQFAFVPGCWALLGAMAWQCVLAVKDRAALACRGKKL